jgi:hypothetical protein
MMYTETVFVVVVTNEFGDVEDRIVFNEWGNAVKFLISMEAAATAGFRFSIQPRDRG